MSAHNHHWQCWQDWAATAGVALPVESEFHHARARVWAASEFVAVTCARHPELFAELVASGDLARNDGAATVNDALAAVLAGVADEPELMQRLRQFRRRRMVSIIWRDLADWAPLDETLAHLSALADACVVQALDWLETWARAELGTPRDAEGRAQRLVVLAMGKLGAGELNLSSDIDLIFAFPRAGCCDGRRALTNAEFFIKLGQRLVKSLDATTSDGFVFRVDTRLRPFGDSGPLAMNFDAMEAYYQAQAREWERYAMIKARVIAGDADDSAELQALLQPFVYRRYLDFGAIDSLRQLKSLIDREVRRQGMADNIKLGYGGIRAIEFIGQAFQLIRGGREPALQVRPILEVLQRLGEHQILPATAVTELSTAYRLLRRVENRLQAWADRQTHVLPNTAPARQRLAESLGYSDWAALEQALNHHRQRVQQHFDVLFAAPEETPTQELGSLWTQEREGAIALFEDAGFADAAAARERLQQFRATIERKGLSRLGTERLAQLMPHLLNDLAAIDQPDQTLTRVLQVLEAILGRTAYLALLAERRDALDQLVKLCAVSPWFAECTARQPLLLDELLDQRRLYAPLRRADLESELDALLDATAPDDLEQRMERLRQFAQGNKLRVAAADVTGIISLMVVSDYLTDIAAVSIQRSLQLAWEDVVRRHGSPTQTDAAHSGFVVLGYGKLGGFELGYHSDLDLVFLYADREPEAPTTGERPITNAQFYIRLGQRLIHLMTTPTYSGVLYEIDMRLRPDGNKGMIARTLNSFADYQRDQAWTWEHQALVRARPVAGDAALGQAFEQVRREVLCRPRDAETLRTEVAQMRAKMRTALDQSTAAQFDLKQGHGGIADIEFMVQYAVLRWAADYPQLVAWTDNIRLLETLETLDLLPDQAAATLTAAYKTLRAAYHRQALQDAPGLIAADQLLTERQQVSTLWQQMMGDG